jgi:hypothetical protein
MDNTRVGAGLEHGGLLDFRDFLQARSMSAAAPLVRERAGIEGGRRWN